MDGRMAGWPDADGELAEMRQEEEEPFLPSTRDALFTLMEIDRRRGIARRNYTNQPDAYPASGEKPIQTNAWTEQVQNRQKTFVANTIEEIAAVFPDHELIQSLGCESCLNLPIVVGGTVIGTLNCLHEAGHYTPERVQAAEILKQPGALAFLLDAYVSRSLEHE